MPNFASKARRSVAGSAAVPVRMKRSAPGRKAGLSVPSAFALDLFGFDVSTFPRGVAGALSFLDPLEGTETSKIVTIDGTTLAQVTWYSSIQDQKWLRLNLRAMTIVLPAMMEAQRPTTGPFAWKKGSTVRPRSVGESRWLVRI